MQNEIRKKLQATIDTIVKRNRNRYLGALSPFQASQGIQAAVTNANDLLKDALLLVNRERFARATSLAILAIEEYGKVDIIRQMLLSSDSPDLKELWREYRSHQSKSVMWLRPYLESMGIGLFEQLDVVHENGFQHSLIADDIKQAGFYSDFGEASWIVPRNLIAEKVAKEFIGVAQQVIPQEAALSSPEALELMVKCVSPLNNKDEQALEQAWLSFYEEAERLGFIDKDQAKRIRLEIHARKQPPFEQTKEQN